MIVGDKVKTKRGFKEKGFPSVSSENPMTVVGFEWPKVLVKENPKKWRVSWLEIIKKEIKESGKKHKK